MWIKLIPWNLFHQTYHVINPLTIIVHDGEFLTEVLNFKLLGPHNDKHLNWQRHIEKLLPKLSAVCYTIRKLSSVLNTEVLRTVYFENFHSLLEYGIIFWGKSSHIGYIFLLQKRIIRIMVRVTSRKLDILTLPCLYIYLLIYVVNNLDIYHKNSSIHTTEMRYKSQLHRPVAKLSCSQNGVF
jgi:hypothetical protein